MIRTIGRQEWEAVNDSCAKGGWLLSFRSVRSSRGSPLILGAYHLGPWLMAFCWRGEVLAYDPEME